MSSSEIWLRRWNLSLFKASGLTGIDLSELHLTFSVVKQQWQSPTQLDCMIYNVGEKLIDQLIAQYTRIILAAGYFQPSKQYGTIFDGNVVYYGRGRLNPTDSYLRVVANGWDQAFTEAVVNTTLPAGAVRMDAVQACLDTFKQYGVDKGKISDLGDAKSTRARALVGKTMDVLRDEAKSADVSCSIDAGKLNMLKASEAISNKAVVLNSGSGMIGIPHQTLGAAIEVRSLLNPLITPGSLIQVNQASIAKVAAPKQEPTGLSATPEQQMQLDLTAEIKTDGFYRVFALTHHGDSRGDPWYTDIKTEPKDPTQMTPKVGV